MYVAGVFVEICEEDEIVSAEQVAQVRSYAGKVNGIREMLKRDRMKVAFHGRSVTHTPSIVIIITIMLICVCAQNHCECVWQTKYIYL